MAEEHIEYGSLDRLQVLHSLYLHMAEGVALCELVLDDRGEATNYRILDANPQFRRYVGREGVHLAGMLATDLFHAGLPPYLAEIASAALGGQPARFDRRFPLSDGYFELSAVPLGSARFALILLDVTASVRKEQALRESEERFRRIFELFPGPVTLSETDGAILSCNDAFCLAVGLRRTEIIGNQMNKFSTWVDPAQRQALFATLAQGKPVEWMEFKMRRQNGELRIMQISAIPFDLDGKKVILSVGRDVTEQRNVEQQMLHSQKLESLGILAGGIAHDFNNLLTGILGNASLAKTEMSPLAPSRECLDSIEAAARRAADLCRQLLAYSGRGRFVVETIDLEHLVKEMGHLLAVSISKKAALKYSFASGVPPIEADATQVRQVIMNLILNASEAIGEATGVIGLSVGTMDCDARTLEACLRPDPIRPGHYVYLEVSDTGQGMDEATLGKIFDPFFSTKFTGRGLGLAAVLGIVRSHKGAIRVESQLGRGTTFRLLFPASPNRSPKGKTTMEIEPGYHGSGTILFADDEEPVRGLGCRILRRVGFEVVPASDGQEALDNFSRDPDHFDLVVLDLTMPRMDGLACFKEMKRIKPSAKIILSSGYNEQDVANRFEGPRPDGYLQKPFSMENLIERIREALSDKQT